MKRALIVGGARSGKYVALLLNDNGYQVTLTDINAVPYKKELQVKGIKVVDLGHPKMLLNTTYDLVVKNPGIKYTADFIVDLINAGYQIVSEVEVALAYAKDYKVATITGTNGKTTTTTILYEMLKKAYKRSFVAGNIGIPVSEIVYKNGLEKAYLALELSSFQLDGIFKLKPFVANITNLKEDHLDYYNSVEQYYTSKQQVYKNQDENDYLLVNLDDNAVLKYLDNPKAKKITYSLKKKSDINIVDNKVFYQDQMLFNINQMKLVGNHNIYNGIVASLMAYLLDVNIEIINDVMHSFKGVEHRIEFVENIGGVKYYNDSKATNIESLIVALSAFEQPVILIAGGYDKKIEFKELMNYTQKVSQVILYGQTKHQLKSIFKQAILVDNLQEAVILAKKLSKADDIVLFSPACASFDQFKDYEQRGDLFKQYVKANND